MAKKPQVFTAAQFTPTQWAAAEIKAEWANKFLKFMMDGFPKEQWTHVLYEKLHYMFGFIAHYDMYGFWDERFSTRGCKAETLSQMIKDPCFGDPKSNWSDVEKALQPYAQQALKQLYADYKRERYAQDDAAAEITAVVCDYPTANIALIRLAQHYNLQGQTQEFLAAADKILERLACAAPATTGQPAATKPPPPKPTTWHAMSQTTLF